MSEPSRDSMLRAETALVPFVRAYGLPVNPGDLELMAYAVLRYGNSKEELIDIAQAVEKLVAEHLTAPPAPAGEPMEEPAGDPGLSGPAEPDWAGS